MISLYRNHLGKISSLLVFFILFLIAGSYYSSTQNLFQLQSRTIKPHIATQYSNSRILSDQNQHVQKNTKKQSILNRDTLLLVIVIICIVVFTLGILICVICIVRTIFRLDRTRTFGSPANANQRNKQCYLKSWEGIQYEIFVDCIGEPYQTNCVICLEEYEYKNPLQIKIQSNRIEEQQIKQEKDEDNLKGVTNNGVSTGKKSNRVDNFLQLQKQNRKRVTTQQIPNHQKNIETEQNKKLKTMKLTVCGHLLHSKCIEKWLQREENCPLCRQTFTQQNLKNWQKKLDIKIFQRDQIPSQNQNFQQTTNEDINSLRNTIRNSSISVQNYPTQQRAPLISSTNQTIQQIEQKLEDGTQENTSTNCIYSRMVSKIKQNKLPQSTKQILQTYAKIMAYHFKKRKKKQQNVMFFESMQQEEVVNDIVLSANIYEGRQNMNRKHSVNSQSQFIQYNRPRKRKRSNKNRQMSPDRLQIDNLQVQYNNE